MINIKNIENLSFCKAVKYQCPKSYICDYSNLPRPCHNFVFMLEGEAKFIVENTTFTLRKGEILYIPKNSTYISQWKAEPKIIFHSVHFNFNSSKDPFNDKIVPVQLLKTEEFDNLYEKVKILQQYQNATSLEYYNYLSAFYYLCGELLPKAKTKENIMTESNIIPALLYLENNYNVSCTISQLASLCYLSSSRFFYLFKKKMGCTPITYKNKIIIQKISQDIILQKDKSIEAIAFDYGFDSLVYFRRLFKKFTGKTPASFRKEEKFV